MLKKIFKYSLIYILVANVNLYALAPLNMLEDGKRAFDLAKWEESCEILKRFMETWPEHDKYNEALYFYTLAFSKTIDTKTEEYRSTLGKKLENAIASLSIDIPDLDISEAKAAFMIAQKVKKPELWDELSKLTPKELKHYLLRGWYPEPSKTPFETLNFVRNKLSNSIDLDSETKSELAILKLKAIWKIMISPLVSNCSKDKLEKTGDYPLTKAFKNTLQIGFKNGNPDQKRRVAVFGYHFDYFKINSLNTNKNINSHWLKYLKSRGTNFSDTWSPE